MLQTEIYWLQRFLQRITTVRNATLSMIYTLDFRGFATAEKEMLGMFDSDNNISMALRRLSGKLPNLRCLILDGHEIKDIRRSSLSFPRLNVLSMRNCQQRMPPQPFDDDSLYSLVYLDLSHTEASNVNVLIPNQRDLERSMHELRVLKLQGRNMNWEMVRWVASRFSGRLWSLDLSGNPLGDELIDLLEQMQVLGETESRLQNDAHFEVEGKPELATSQLTESAWMIEESKQSATFSHPDRYLVDPPVYQSEYFNHTAASQIQQGRRVRLTGAERVRSDTLDEVLSIFDGGLHRPAPLTTSMPNPVPRPGGLTHIRLNDLDISTKRIERLLMMTCGFFEHVEFNQARYCTDKGDLAPLKAKAGWDLGVNACLYGVPGLSYIFRPVISSNLRVLKVHHSLVTNVPTLASSTTNVLERLWLAETVLRERVDLAFPQTFVPDMNPRLYSLTLSKVPRYSTGLVIERLIHFLKLAAQQEQDIETTRKDIPSRGPTVVRGLRHIRLEFDDDGAVEEYNALGEGMDIAAAMEEFAFFSESAWGTANVDTVPSPNNNKKSSSAQSDKPTAQPTVPNDKSELDSSNTLEQPTRYTSGVYKCTSVDSTHYTWKVNSRLPEDTQSNVWVGNGVSHPNNPPAVNAYMRVLSSNKTQTSGILPATTAQIAAGVPPGELIFNAAWERILVPEGKALARPGVKRVRGMMRDVLAEVKNFRLASRQVFLREGQGEYWKGRLEIDLPRSSG